MKERIIIRDIAERDFSLLPEFLYQTFLHSSEEAPPPREIIYEAKQLVYHEDFGGRDDFGVVAEIDGTVVGIAWSRLIKAYGYVDDDTPEFAVAILPEFRGLGLGTKLLERLFEVLRLHGYLRVSLSVDVVNPALRLYERLGFKLVREGDDDDYVMVKEFPPEKMDDFFADRIEVYDEHMLVDMEMGEFYDDIPAWIGFEGPAPKLLDLGCGTGLALRGLYERHPAMRFTGIDLSRAMLDKLREKYPEKDLELICASFFDVEFDEGYDVVLSLYALHHFDEDTKRGFYRRIHEALAPGGVFLLGDYIVRTAGMQDRYMDENARLREEHGLADDEFYHIDIPLTTECEIRLMREAGFSSTQVLFQTDNTSVILAQV